MKYNKVTCMRGHLGRGYTHGLITFYYVAESIMHAINIAKKQGGVKHSRMPVNCVEITYEEYITNKKVNAYDRALCR